MNEMMRNMAMLLWAYYAIGGTPNAHASVATISEETPQAQETVVFGAANTPKGNQDMFVVEQPSHAANPLGNPIWPSDDNNNPSPTPIAKQPAKPVQPPMRMISRDAVGQEQGPGEIPLPQNGRIENELYQEGDDIIDEQAFPIRDMDEVTEPNLQPAIITQ